MFCLFVLQNVLRLFQVFSAANGQEIGLISKQWSGLGREILTDSDNFGVSFPIDLDVKLKATLISACFLIDFMFFFEENSGIRKFEKNQRKNRN